MRDGVGGGLNATLSDYLMSHSVCNSLMEHTDYVSCLCEQSAYVNTYVDRQVGQPIIVLGLKNMIR